MWTCSDFLMGRAFEQSLLKISNNKSDLQIQI